MDKFIDKLLLYDDRVSLIYKDKSITYLELVVKIKSLHKFIKETIPEGGVVLLNSGLSIESIVYFFALFLNRNIIVPVADMNSEEVKNRILISSADFIIRISSSGLEIEQNETTDTLPEIYQEIENNRHPGLVLFSSGITGTPKGMVHDLFILMSPFLTKKAKNISFMAMLMFDHIGGLNTVFSALFSGATLVIPENRDPYTVCNLIEKHKVGVLPASPTMLNLILMSGAFQKFDLNSIRVITYGTEPMPEGLLLKLNNAFPKVRFIQTFGTSETGITQISSKSSSSIRLKFDDPETDYKIVEGELWIKSKTVIKGYLNAEMDQFTPEGWFKTGDLADAGDDGYFIITGRKNEIINVGGLKVYPQEVESVLMEIPIIANCLVYGEKNPITGNIVLAKVQLTGSVDKTNALTEIRSYLRSRLDRYKIPLKIHFVGTIDHNDRFKKIRNI